MASWYIKVARCDYCACTTTCYCACKSKICLSCVGKLYRTYFVPFLQQIIAENEENMKRLNEKVKTK